MPRQFWRDKPVNMPSAEFESTYMGMPRSFNGFQFHALYGGSVQELLFAGSICLECSFSECGRDFFISGSVRPAGENGVGLFLYAALFPEMIHSLEADVGNAVGYVIRASVVAVGVALLLGARFRKFRRVKTVPGPRIVAGRPGRFATPSGETRLGGARNHLGGSQ